MSGLAGTTLLYLLKREWRIEVCEGMRSAGSMKVATFAVNDAADLLGNWLFVSAVALAPTAGYVSLALGIQPIYVIGIVYCLSRINPEIINEQVTRQKLLRAVFGTLLIVSGLAVLSRAR